MGNLYSLPYRWQVSMVPNGSSQASSFSRGGKSSVLALNRCATEGIRPRYREPNAFSPPTHWHQV